MGLAVGVVAGFGPLSYGLALAGAVPKICSKSMPRAGVLGGWMPAST